MKIIALKIRTEDDETYQGCRLTLHPSEQEAAAELEEFLTDVIGAHEDDIVQAKDTFAKPLDGLLDLSNTLNHPAYIEHLVIDASKFRSDPTTTKALPGNYFERKGESEAEARARLAACYGEACVWTDAEARQEFEFCWHLAPVAFVIRKSDGRQGVLYYEHFPRIYYQRPGPNFVTP